MSVAGADHKLSDKEIAERMTRALQRSFAMAPKSQKEIAGKSGRRSQTKPPSTVVQKGKKNP